MRISVRKGDPGYHPEASQKFQVLLDGRDVTGLCHTADEGEGRVYGYALNSLGQKYIDPVTDRPAEQILFGHVQIIELLNGARAIAEPC